MNQNDHRISMFELLELRRQRNVNLYIAYDTTIKIYFISKINRNGILGIGCLDDLYSKGEPNITL